MLRYLSLVLTLLVMTACTTSTASAPGVSDPTPEVSSSDGGEGAIAGTETGLTYENFLAITWDDTLETVRAKFGVEGEMRSPAAPEAGLGPTFAFPDDSVERSEQDPQVLVEFDASNKVLNKTQFNLAVPKKDYDPSLFDAIELGKTTRQEVETLLGDSAVLKQLNRPSPEQLANPAPGEEFFNIYFYNVTHSEVASLTIFVDDADVVRLKTQSDAMGMAVDSLNVD